MLYLRYYVTRDEANPKDTPDRIQKLFEALLTIKQPVETLKELFSTIRMNDDTLHSFIFMHQYLKKEKPL